MDLYHYRPDNGEYIGPGKADPDPLEEGNWLYPAYSTSKSPPKTKVGKARVFSSGNWSYAEDHRGETWWDEHGQPVVIQDLGNPADSGLSSEEPEPEPELPVTPTPVPQLTAVALLQVVDGNVVAVGVAAGVSFAMRLDTGLIWLFFSQEMADLSYSYSYTVLPSSGRATVTDRQLSYMEITITEDGNPVDPAELSVQVYRAT